MTSHEFNEIMNRCEDDGAYRARDQKDARTYGDFLASNAKVLRRKGFTTFQLRDAFDAYLDGYRCERRRMLNN